MNSGLFNVEIVNGEINFSFTDDGISQFGIGTQDNSFTATLRVVDEQGLQSDVHSILIEINNNGAPNNAPVILDENNDQDGVSGNDVSGRIIDESDVTDFVAEFEIIDERVRELKNRTLEIPDKN